MSFHYGYIDTPCPFVDALLGHRWITHLPDARVDDALVGAAESLRLGPHWLDVARFEHRDGMPRGSAWFYFGSTPMQRPTKTDARSTSRSGEVVRE